VSNQTPKLDPGIHRDYRPHVAPRRVAATCPRLAASTWRQYTLPEDLISAGIWPDSMGGGPYESQAVGTGVDACLSETGLSVSCRSQRIALPVDMNFASRDAHYADTRPFSCHADDRQVKTIDRLCIATANSAPRSSRAAALGPAWQNRLDAAAVAGASA
jgi:hypothetical protein